ncbi:MAG: class II glutamine amidotransferase [Thermoanaerobaculia bacterium]|nr:class II glutamine amidotransferase [Thermoanaerobaculia bacterium]
MCRLYGLHATHPTKPGCELLHAQNALIRQSLEDERGFENPDGWGIGWVRDGVAECTRQVDPAHESERYRAEALSTEAETVVAHVRRATVGSPRPENTHPFRWDDSFLAHNGHIGRFDEVRPRLLEALPEARRGAIGGSTDSEHFFQLVLAELHERGAPSMAEALRRAVGKVRDWVAAVDPNAAAALNTLWVENGRLAGTRLGRSLWSLERDAPFECPICDHRHAEPGDEPYRAVVLASERITDEAWQSVPDGSVFWIDRQVRLDVEPLGL